MPHQNYRASIEIINTLYDIERQLDDLFRKQARKFGLSYSEFCILYSFSMDAAPKTAQRLAKENFMSKQTISSSLARMEKKRWICFVRGEDRREKLISLTETGVQVRCRTTDRLLDIDERVMKKIGFEEIRRDLNNYRKYLELMTEEYGRL